MEAPAITRHRRPFLAPVWLSLLALVAIGTLAWSFYRGAGTTVVLLVRPADKNPGTIADPPLSPEGEERAQRLARMFGDTNAGAHLDGIYVSADRQAQQSATPLAERLHRAPVVVGADAAAAATRLVREHPGGTLLVIGGGATVPQMIRALTGMELPAPAQDESEFLYVASIPSFGRANLTRLRF